MISLKNQREIEIMREGGSKLRKVLIKVLAAVKPGVTELDLDKLATEEILIEGGKVSFKMVPGYNWATCLTVNDEVVHGIPGERTLKEGDIVGIDLGMYFKGYHTDLATTVKVGSGKNEQIDNFLRTGKVALEKAITQAKKGNFIGDISQTIQTEIEANGYAPVKVLTGHGVGKELHESPNIPGFLSGKKEKTPKIEAGMTLAIEVIYNQGSEKVVLEDDGWTISTWDGKISGLFEETVVVTKDGPLILTR